MPFQSKRQARWMFKHHPKMAKEWAKKTDFAALPETMAQGKERDEIMGLMKSMRGKSMIPGMDDEKAKPMAMQPKGHKGM